MTNDHTFISIVEEKFAVVKLFIRYNLRSPLLVILLMKAFEGVHMRFFTKMWFPLIRVPRFNARAIHFIDLQLWDSPVMTRRNIHTSSRVRPLVSGMNRYTYPYPNKSIPKKINNMRGPILSSYLNICRRENQRLTYVAAIFGAKNERRKFHILVYSVYVGKQDGSYRISRTN